MLLLIVAFNVIFRTADRHYAGGRSFHHALWTAWMDRRVDATVKSRYDATPINNIHKYNPFSSHNHITIYFFYSGAVWLCRCGVRGVNMPVWGVRCVYAGVPYSCTPVCVRKPCCSVTLYFVVSTSINAAARPGRNRHTSGLRKNAIVW